MESQKDGCRFHYKIILQIDASDWSCKECGTCLKTARKSRRIASFWARLHPATWRNSFADSGELGAVRNFF